jgi:hypothetical protein
MSKKIFVEFYKRNAAGQFISLNDGMEVVTSKPVIEVIRKVVARIIQRNERGLFKRVQAYRILKNDEPFTPILTVKE